MPGYETVIVGGGSAGCVLAARLSQAGERVLLLEAGGRDDDPAVAVPARLSELIGSAHDWADVTVPQAGLDGRQIRWPRGRLLGGSSSVNATLYVEGDPADYDRWQVSGWGGADLAPAFARARAQLSVAPLASVHELSAAFVAAAVAAGHPARRPGEVSAAAGAGIGAVTQRGGRRRSTAAAYLSEAPGLTVRIATPVDRIEFSGHRATGVRTAGGESISAGRVVLAAGAVGTPLILQRSGIGDPAVLQAAGVRPWLDLPVGEELSDHLAIGVVWTAAATLPLHGLPDLERRRWADRGDGPLVSGNAEAFLFAASRPGPVDLQVHAGAAAFLGDARGPAAPRFTAGPVLLSPGSRGTVRIAGADPATPPLIDPAYLSDPADVAALRAGIDLVREVAGHAPLAGLLDGEIRPLGDDLARRASTLFHPTGTVGLGRVVDGSLAVTATERLHVCDASVLPEIPRGNTNAAVVAVAERAAEVLRG